MPATSRDYHIWTGNFPDPETALPPERCEMYRRAWTDNVGVSLDELRSLSAGAAPPRQSRNVPCVHRGAETRRITCATCRGNVKSKVFACDLHGECVVANRQARDGLLACESCSNFVPQSTALSPAVKAAPAFRPPEIPVVAKHVTRWAAGVTTAPRNSPTLKRSLDSIRAAGFDPVIFAEPETPLSGIEAEIVQRRAKLGVVVNWIQGLQDLLARFPDAQALAMFQDDILLCKGVREFLEHDLWPRRDSGVVSLYCPNAKGYERESFTGTRRISQKNLIGACAMVVPRHVAELIVTGQHRNKWRGFAEGGQSAINDPARWKALDAFIGHALAAAGLSADFYDPSLVQHIGKTSTLYGKLSIHAKRQGREFRRSKRFPGEDAKASEVYRSHRPAFRWNLPSCTRRWARASVDVVIPAVDGFDLTSRCLHALAASQDVDLRVIYVDNGSAQSTIERVRSLLRDLRFEHTVVEMGRNVGFTAAVNAGLEHGRSDVLLLNNDCFVDQDTIACLAGWLRSDLSLAAVGPLTNDSGSQSIAKDARLKRIMGQSELSATKVLSFFCCLLRREAINELGTLSMDRELRQLGSDDEWCIRARKSRYRVGVACDAFAEHLHKSTFRSHGIDRKALQGVANRHLYGGQ